MQLRFVGAGQGHPAKRPAAAHLAALQCLAQLAQELLQMVWGDSLLGVPGAHSQRQHILNTTGVETE